MYVYNSVSVEAKPSIYMNDERDKVFCRLGYDVSIYMTLDEFDEFAKAVAKFHYLNYDQLEFDFEEAPASSSFIGGGSDGEST